jgi:hypothetical protein
MKFTGNRDIAVTMERLEKSRIFYENVIGFNSKKVGKN